MGDVIWINASAGSGKTKRLIDRILYLILNGVNPSEILCVTFTKAAALEMDERLTQKAFAIKSLSLSELELLISELGCKNLSFAKTTALNLYEILKNNKVNIKTVHSFAKSIIENYSYKYNLDKNFEIISDSEKKLLIKTSFENIIQRSYKKNNFDDKVLSIISKYFNEEQVIENFCNILMYADLFDFEDIKTLLDLYNDKFAINLDAKLLYKDSKEMVLESLKKTIKDDLWDLIIALKQENCPDDTIKTLEQFLNELIIEKVTNYEEFINLFLTKTLEKRKTTIKTKNVFILELLENIQSQIYESMVKYSDYENGIVSFSLVYLFREIFQEYQLLKQERNSLDYDDIINYSIKILKSEIHKEILYKIDNDLKHLLVDEAQDTNNYQWEILKLITEEFFYIDVNNQERSIFIVGDEKQSIYSFQGVSVKNFSNIKAYFKQKTELSGKRWVEQISDISYRTNGNILEIVDKVFKDDYIKKNMSLFSNMDIKHNAFFKRKGYVEIYPLEKKSKDENAENKNEENDQGQVKRQSSLIVNIIIEKLKENIPSLNRKANPGDFFILFQKRSKLMNQIVLDLKNANIPVSGVDKININESPIILDLITLAKFIACPLDDMNLAVLLKGPFFAITEDQLFLISTEREENALLFSVKKYFEDIYEKLQDWINLSKRTTIYEFFITVLESSGFTEVFCERFGEIARALINNFYELIDEFESLEISDYNKFCFWLLSRNNEFKNTSQEKNQVKLMTVHASKGLESPYVILADANVTYKKKSNILIDEDVLVCSLNQKSEIIKNILKTESEKNISEYYRLLYVAMTRAKDALIVTGGESHYKSDNSWYSKIYAELQNNNLSKNINDILKFGDDFDCSDCDEKIEDNTNVEHEKGDEKLPIKNYENVVLQKNTLDISLMSQEEKKGQIFHNAIMLLNEINDLNELENYINNKTIIDENTKKYLIQKLSQVHEKFPWFFNMKSYPEQSFIYEVDGIKKEGRVDLMIMDDDYIKIIDFKFYLTEQISQQITEQLSLYKKSILKITGKKVKTYIFWVNSLRLEEVDV